MAPSSSITVRILLVEEDPAYLPVATSMLQLFDFQVFIAQNPLEAVSALELRRDSFYFDLVLSDLQMSMMNAVEFRKLIDQKFHLPVVLMSSEHKRSILFGGLLQNGLPFFVDKPPSADDLMSLRQYVISKRKEERGNLRSLKRRLFEDDFEAERIHELEYLTANHKRPKLVWTNELHKRFLEAVNSLGFQRAVPKKILEYMNVPGLTRENVASHLQKYRVYLKRLCKTNSSTRSGMLRSWHGGPFRSTFFCPPHPTVATNNSLPYYSNTINPGQQTTEALPFVFGQNSLGGQQAKTLPSMYAHGASTSSMPLMGTYSGAFQGPSMINTLPNNNVLYPESSGAFQGPSMINTLPNNNVLYPANILGTASATHAEMGHFTGQNNARESFIPIVQNNSQPIDGGYLTDAAMQFFSSPRPTLNLAGNNQGQTLVPMMPQMGGVTANYGGEPSVQYGGLLNNLANDMTNGNMTLPEQGNPKVNSTILADDGLESFLSSLEEEALNKDQTPQNPFVKQDVTVAQVGNHIPTDLQVPVENIASHVPLIKNDAEQEMSNSGTSSGSSVLFQDWEAGNLDEFCLDGIDDLVAFLSNFEGNNGSDNQLP